MVPVNGEDYSCEDLRSFFSLQRKMNLCVVLFHDRISVNRMLVTSLHIPTPPLCFLALAIAYCPLRRRSMFETCDDT
jgi:hypothetical protein